MITIVIGKNISNLFLKIKHYILCYSQLHFLQISPHFFFLHRSSFILHRSNVRPSSLIVPRFIVPIPSSVLRLRSSFIVQRCNSLRPLSSVFFHPSTFNVHPSKVHRSTFIAHRSRVVPRSFQGSTQFSTNDLLPENHLNYIRLFSYC